MPSPFPGMDPSLERPGVWHGFHSLFLPRLHAALVSQVRPRYVVQLQESLFVTEEVDDDDLPRRDPDDEDRPTRRRRRVAEGDVFVTRPPAAAEGGDGSNGHGTTAVIEAPMTVVIPPLTIPRKHRWIEVRDARDLAVVTLIELLSPANKRPGPGRRQYFDKRVSTVQAGINLVEIDLLRRGPRLPLDDPPPCDYYALVARPDEWPDAGFWPIGLRDPLPAVPVPLRPGDADARLDLQALLDAVYDAAGYADYLHRQAPDPPLAPADQAWADDCLAAAPRTAGQIGG